VALGALPGTIDAASRRNALPTNRLDMACASIRPSTASKTLVLTCRIGPDAAGREPIAVTDLAFKLWQYHAGRLTSSLWPYPLARRHFNLLSKLNFLLGMPGRSGASRIELKYLGEPNVIARGVAEGSVDTVGLWRGRIVECDATRR
jgi:hypothetical protein